MASSTSATSTRSLVDVVTGADRRAGYEAAGLWTEDTLAARVAEHARGRGDEVAVVDSDGARERTFAELERDSNRVAQRLLELGVAPGEVVSVQLPNWYETVAVDLGVLKVGAVVNPMLPIYRARELGFMLGAAEVAVLFTPMTYRGFDHVQLVEEVRQAGGLPRHHVAVPTPSEDVADRELGDWIGASATSPVEVPTRSSDVSELIFTSGTEAQPKAIMHTEQTTNFGARNLAATLGMVDGDVVWMPSPVGHSTGLNYGARIALYHGLKLVLQDRWSPAVAAALISAHRCSYTVAATTFVSDLVEHAQGADLDLSSLRLFGSGGAPVPADVVRAAAALGMSVLRMYGSTEALAVTWNRPDAGAASREQTDGSPMLDVEVDTRDEEGRSVRGEPGEIFIRSPSASVGFFADPERTAATWDPDGWIRSGDLGVIDEAGCLSIVGRKKEIIIRGGLNIAPREIEDVLQGHEDIVDVAVVGLPDERLGEITCACVVVKEQRSLTLEELVAFAKKQGLATFKLPQRLEICAELPKTSTGKIQKHQLKTRIRDGS